MECLQQGLAPYVERETLAAIRANRLDPKELEEFRNDPNLEGKTIPQWDVSPLLKLMWKVWNEVFRSSLGFSERSLVSELREWRNKWAHQENFTSDDTYRALDSIVRLLNAISSPKQAEEVDVLKKELQRMVYDQQLRDEKKKVGGSLGNPPLGTLKPWRQVIQPHPDVLQGEFLQAEFAADLWQVHQGHGSPEYLDPEEFFRRTFLTESLKQLLLNGVKRIRQKGGDPVVQLQTNFGGGKTHSMLALYHLFSGIQVGKLREVDALLASQEGGQEKLPSVRRVVLVGNKISPGNPSVKEDGTTVRTLWGELAYQLGGKAAYNRIAKDDENATNPGDTLRLLFKEYGPCLILIDEWVAYARQLHEEADLPGGSFETQFSFAQALTEAARAVPGCLLVISLPASDAAFSNAQTEIDDVEVGGNRGRAALQRLSNVIGRMESAWRPATGEESFEIVRRRLFEPLSGEQPFRDRDVTARAFSEQYQKNKADFPSECSENDYEKRIRAAYPIHPEVFDRLYRDWATLRRFQRTRGVLRLMAAVIHSLWEQGDQNPLILPCTLPIDDRNVMAELSRYLPDNWSSVLEGDVDGPGSTPVRLDNDNSRLGQFSAARRVARTLFLGSAPATDAAHPGMFPNRIRLGCVRPGEVPDVFDDALRRLVNESTYLYRDNDRYWYSTHPTLAKMARDRAKQLERHTDKVLVEIENRVRADLKKKGEFWAVHPFPGSSADVPDDFHTRLVVLSPRFPHHRGNNQTSEDSAIAAANNILNSRGNAPRIFRNTLVFLAADGNQLSSLQEAVRFFLAWKSILDEKQALNLDPQRENQARDQMNSFSTTVDVRVGETFRWLLAPEQASPTAKEEFHALRLSAKEPLAHRAHNKLVDEAFVVSDLASTILRKKMDDIPLWQGNHVAVKKLVEYFASYLYLPRLSGPEVLTRALEKGVALESWTADTFAYAESYDEQKARYLALVANANTSISPASTGIIVKPDVA
ncbi:MAG TPA: Swt1 family HEPN domain-containing protein, partial [Thermotogota bacterium]|nr:Swt1 family HEPN domain-containing protein [Thermotogota bacterium]